MILKLLLALGFLVEFIAAYRHALPLDFLNLCKDTTLTCGDEPQTICREESPDDSCSGFHKMEIGGANANAFVLGHNGIRNKIANNWKISNMNLLHWSRELEIMAKVFLFKCLIGLDTCDFIGNRNITVGQTFTYFNSPPGHRWAGRAIRKWYLEIGPETDSFDDFRKTRRRVHNFTQMVWPTTEFVGCNAAEMFHGFLVVCFYSPTAGKGKYDYSKFKSGASCSRCSHQRPTCSRDFTSLCGLDLPLMEKSTNWPPVAQPYYFLITTIIYYLM